MSFSASTTASSATPTNTFAGGNNNGPGTNTPNNNGISSSLYLFTFLITVLVLGVISGLLLFRAYYIRRKFQERVEEAIRNNQPLPPDAARALGLIRPHLGGSGKKDKKVGPMPALWEAEMEIDRKAGEVSRSGEGGGYRDDKEKWDEFIPVSVVHFPPGPNPYSSDLPKYFIPPPRQRRFLPSFIPVHRPLPRLAYEPDQTPANIPRSGPNWQVPPVGEELTVGVLIALPFEEEVDELWIGKEDGEGEVPQVCLGVVAVRID